WIAKRKILPEKEVRGLRPADSAADVHIAAAHVGGKIKSGCDGRAPAPLPAVQNMRNRALRSHAVVFAERQIVHPASGKFVPLIEARKTPVSGNVERILRHNYPAQ